MVAAALAPSIRSLICTSPRATSSPPWMTTQGLPRLSAYFICAFMPAVPRYISARMPRLAQRLRQLLVARQLGLIHDEHDDGAARRAGVRSCRVAASAACRRETPMEKPVAGTRWPVKRATRSS